MHKRMENQIINNTMKAKLYAPEQMAKIIENTKATAWMIFLFVAAIIVIAIYI